MNSKLQLNKETIRQLDESELDLVDGGVGRNGGFVQPTTTAQTATRRSSVMRPTSSVRRPVRTGGGGRVSSIRPTATAVPTTRMSSVRPGGA